MVFVIFLFLLFHSNGAFCRNCRTCGVEVDCAFATGLYLYHTDETVAGGANVMIEICRQVLDDVSRILAHQGKKLPNSISFSFDNSGENKNKFMICFQSHLVLADKFLDISVRFELSNNYLHMHFEIIFPNLRLFS